MLVPEGDLFLEEPALVPGRAALETGSGAACTVCEEKRLPRANRNEK